MVAEQAVQQAEARTDSAPISPQVGDAVSEAVRQFAAAYGWGDESFDLWYHGEPVWFVRRDEADGIVRRVQVAPFNTSAGPQLVVMPDVYQWDAAAKRIVGKPSPAARTAGKQTRSLQKLDSLIAHGNRDKAVGKIVGAIEQVWKAAESLPVEPVS